MRDTQDKSRLLDWGPDIARLGYCPHIQEPDQVGEDMLSSCQVNCFLPQPGSCPREEYSFVPNSSSCPDYLSEPPCSSGSRSMVTGRWGFWALLRDCPSPQKSMMKAPMLIGALVMVGFTVGKGKWGRGREGGVAEYREGGGG